MEVPRYLVQLGAVQGAAYCDAQRRACLSSATQHRCAGYPVDVWHRGAAAWIALAAALRGGVARGCE
jgi:hypothetical protein